MVFYKFKIAINESNVILHFMDNVKILQLQYINLM